MQNDIISIPREQYQRWCRRLQNSRRLLATTATTSITSASSSSTNLKSTTTSDFHSVWCLPPELLLEILSYLTSRQSTLYQASLVCRQWFLCTTPILYKHPRIHNTYRWATFLLSLNRDKRLLNYGSLVQSIDLSCRDQTKDILKMKYQNFTRSARMAAMNRGPSSPYAQPLLTTSAAASRGNTTTITTTTTTFTMNDEDNYPDNEAADDDLDDHTNTDTTENDAHHFFDILAEDDHYMSYHSSPSLVVSSSSLIKLAQACPNLVSIDLSFTHMFSDSLVEETGDYISTLQHYAIPPGLTHVKVPIETAISVMGQHCTQLQQVKIQCCGWVCARIIWLWTVSCPNLTYMDARSSSKCSVKRFTTHILQVREQPQHHAQPQQNMQPQQQNSASLSPSSSSSSSSPPSSSSSQTPLQQPSSSSSSSSLSSSSSSSSSLTSSNQWTTGENGNRSSTSTSTSAFASSSTSANIPEPGPMQRESAEASLTAQMDTTEEGPIEVIENDDDHQRQHQAHHHHQRHRHHHTHPFFHRHHHRHGLLPPNIGRFLMTIYMNDDPTYLENILGGQHDAQDLVDDLLPPFLNRQPAPPLQTTAIATTTANVPLPPGPAITTNRFAIRSRVYREFLAASSSSNQNNTVYITNQTMREYVWSVLKDAKAQGLMELEWMQE